MRHFTFRVAALFALAASPLALQRSCGQWTVAYTSEGHTGSMVPLFASGPGADRLAGIRDDDEIGRILVTLLLGESP